MVEVTQSSCGDDRHVRHALSLGDGGGFLLDTDLGKTERMTLPEAPEMPLTCYLRGKDFHCAGDMRAPVGRDRDATVTTTLTVSGRFVDPVQMQGTIDITVGCEGVYCYGMKLTGCSVEKNFEASL